MPDWYEVRGDIQQISNRGRWGQCGEHRVEDKCERSPRAHSHNAHSGSGRMGDQDNARNLDVSISHQEDVADDRVTRSPRGPPLGLTGLPAIGLPERLMRRDGWK